MKKTLLLTFALVLCALARLCAQQEAVLRPGDTFDMRISGVPADDQQAISSNYTVDGQGFINVSLIGKLKVAGRTGSEVQTLVERTYIDQKIFTHPTITVSIASAARFVNVAGQVKTPGRIPYTPDMTILTAINAAGDFTEFADQAKVHLARGSRANIVNCKKIRANPSLDVKVLPGDMIQVPETMF